MRFSRIYPTSRHFAARRYDSAARMLVHPDIDPVAFSIGPLAVRWYGLMYLAGFAAGWGLGIRRIDKGMAPVSRAQFDDLLFLAVLGVILGGRLGYVLFYKPDHYAAHPLEILAVWQGGMSFHGGLLGVMLAMVFAARRHHVDYLRLMDFVAPLVPLGLAAGRLGNFINGELWGRVTDLPWGMVFRNAGDAPRHPSQLYQFALEGLTLFAILWWFSAKPRPRGQVSALFLIGYGVLRFIAEFAREPDAFLGYRALAGVARSPLIWPIALAVLLLALGVKVPLPIERFATLLAAAAGPCALFAIGLFVSQLSIAEGLRASWPTTTLKLVLHPLLMALVAYYVLPIDAFWAKIAVVCASLPLGATAFVLAQRYRLLEAETSTGAVLSTAASVVSVSLVMTLLAAR